MACMRQESATLDHQRTSPNVTSLFVRMSDVWVTSNRVPRRTVMHQARNNRCIGCIPERGWVTTGDSDAQPQQQSSFPVRPEGQRYSVTPQLIRADDRLPDIGWRFASTAYRKHGWSAGENQQRNCQIPRAAQGRPQLLHLPVLPPAAHVSTRGGWRQPERLVHVLGQKDVNGPLNFCRSSCPLPVPTSQ